ncbi:hypothetical protein [Siminovitchia sp. 179-K 8D1 HS]|uniref:hypothetical protein n=1 Tax=Siminovitchia sp. 179-K 8D1 HS TaxID=3142385 RepID=UPI0039A1A2CA
MTKQKQNRKICSKCEKEKSATDFYLSANNIINADGRLPICKTCLESVAHFDDIERFIDVCRMIDRPFIRSEYAASFTAKKPFGEYFRRIGMPQNKSKTYLNSEFDGNFSDKVAKPSSEVNKRYDASDLIDFKVTSDIVVRWGNGYSEQELYQLESFYESMIRANDITTPQHVEQLKLLCKLNLEQNKALDEGRINDFKNLNTQYNKVLENSGFRPIDRKSGGESVGIRTFSQIWEEIEKDGFIEPYPYQEKQDIVDKTIMYMGNYTRKLVNMQSMSEPPEDTPKVDGSDEA